MRTMRGAAVIACLAACGQSASTDGDAGDASLVEAAADVVQADASDASSDAAVSVPYVGEVALLESAGDGGPAFSAQAAFFTTFDAGVACAAQVGSCCRYAATDGGALGTRVGAGAITFKYASKTIGTMTPTGTTYPPLTSASTASFVWVPGDLVDVSGAGDTVHAFFGSVATAKPFAGVTPSFGAPTTISRSQDFVVSWTPSNGSIRLALLQSSAGDSIVCSASSDPGSMTIDKSLLASFANGAGTIALVRALSADGASDNAAVTISASASATNAATYSN